MVLDWRARHLRAFLLVGEQTDQMRVWEYTHANNATLPLHSVQRQDKLPRLFGKLVGTVEACCHFAHNFGRDRRAVAFGDILFQS